MALLPEVLGVLLLILKFAGWLICQVHNTVYETQFSKIILMLVPEKNCALQRVNRRQEQSTSMSHPYDA